MYFGDSVKCVVFPFFVTQAFSTAPLFVLIILSFSCPLAPLLSHFHDINWFAYALRQILAITVTIVPVFGTVQAFRKYGRRQRARDLALSLDIRLYATTNTLQSTSSHINLYLALSSIHSCLFYLRDPAVTRPFHRKQLRHSSA
jgi:hypothetical protein